MKTIEIKAEARKDVGKKSSQKIRKQKHVPCVLYGGKENIHFHAYENDFQTLIYNPSVFLINLSIDGKNYQAIMKDAQYHPVTDKVQHIDFMEVSKDTEVKIEVPVKISGNSIGVKNGGKLRIRRRKLLVKALAENLPDVLEIDITKLRIGDSLKVRDLKFDNLLLMDPPSALVTNIVSSRVAAKGMEIEEEGAEEATEEGATAEGAESPADAEGEEEKAEE